MKRFLFSLFLVSDVRLGHSSTVEVLERRLSDCPDTFSHFPGTLSGDPPRAIRILLPGRGKTENIELAHIMGDGATARSFISADKRYIIKAPLSGGNLAKFVLEACREKVLLEHLLSLGMASDVPKLYSLASSHGAWDQALLVLENVGAFHLKDLETSDGSYIANSPLLYQITARLLGILRELNSKGVYHGDIHEENIMFSSSRDIVESIRLIDFGRAGPVTQDPGQTWIDVSSLIYMMNNLGWDRYTGYNPVLERIREVVSSECDSLDEPPYALLIRALNIAARATKAMEKRSIQQHGYSEIYKGESFDWELIDTIDKILYHQVPLEEYLENIQDLKARTIDCTAQLGAALDGDLDVHPTSPDRFNEDARSRLIDKLLRDTAGLTTYTVDFALPEDVPGFCNEVMLFSERDRVAAHMIPEADIPRFAVKAIELLRSLHSMGMVHAGNFKEAFTVISHDESLDSVALSRTGSMRLFVKDAPETKCALKRVVGVYVLSPGEMQGFCPIRYDDMYRLAELLIGCLAKSPARRTSYEPIDVIDFKQNKLKLSLDDTPFADTLNAFHEAMFVGSMERDGSRPHYEEWIDTFSKLS